MEENDNSLFTRLVIREVNEEAEGFRSFMLEPVSGKKMNYKAGQYITLVHQGRVEEVRRSYSFTSAPNLHEPMTIGVKRIANGSFSRLLFQMKAGDQISASGCGGFFTLPEKMEWPSHLFFLAAGSGITPVFSLIKTALAANHPIQITLVYSNRSPETAIFLNTLQQLSEKHKGRFNIEWLFSEDQNLLRSHLNPELLTDFLKKYVADITSALFYICGPEAYMRMCLFTLKKEGTPESHIRKETFLILKNPALKEEPPDKSPQRVTIRFGEKQLSMLVQYPDTILAAARSRGMALPYSCEAGKCGNCAARLVSGKVWMSYNEVLSEQDLRNGLILTCTGYAVEGDALLEI